MIIDLLERKNIEIENITDKQLDVLMNSILQIVKVPKRSKKLLKSSKFNI